MRRIHRLTIGLFALAAFGAGPALANVCQTDQLSCATTMPAGGFCQCTLHGKTQDGTAGAKAAPHQPMNATAGGCGAHPNAPGCR